jgi:hypothetical protein
VGPVGLALVVVVGGFAVVVVAGGFAVVVVGGGVVDFGCVEDEEVLLDVEVVKVDATLEVLMAELPVVETVREVEVGSSSSQNWAGTVVPEMTVAPAA